MSENIVRFRYIFGITMMTIMAGYVFVTLVAAANGKNLQFILTLMGLLTLPFYLLGLYLSTEVGRKVDADLALKFIEVEMATRALEFRSIPELPPDEPMTMLFKGPDETRRIAGEPIGEWVRIAKQLKKYNYRLRARALGADYEKAAQMFGENPYACKKVSKSFEFTDWGLWLVDYLTTLPPSEYKSIRYSVIRRLTHTYTHAGEVV